LSQIINTKNKLIILLTKNKSYDNIKLRKKRATTSQNWQGDKMRTLTKKEMKAVKKIQEYLNMTDQQAQDNYDNDYLSINIAKNGKEYAWYIDEKENVAVEIDTLELITNENILKNLF
jgi:hypothetical protein